MAFTQTDLDRVNAAIASGAVHVQYADGRNVTYRSIEELKTAKAEIQAALGLPSGQPRTRQVRLYSGKGF
jgi:hypothetical protein